MLANKALSSAPSAEPVFVESVFSTYLYTGNASTQTITNGIDLSGKGGLVWIKSRSAAENHFLFDTARGANAELNSNTTDASTTLANSLTAFNGNGFSIGNAATAVNTNATTYVSWAFREQAKFFDVVTYTGNGTNRTIAHNLGSAPGCIIVKCTSLAGTNWAVYHRSLTSAQYALQLNNTGAQLFKTAYWNSTAPTSTVFSLGNDTDVNQNGATYVAYLFAHNAGGFGLTGTDNVISCGSYTGNGSATGPVVTLGYEPQWLLVKRTDVGGNYWQLVDVLRGMSESDSLTLSPNSADADNQVGAPFVVPTATGFRIATTGTSVNANGSTYIYIAIRRGPMKVPTSGTSVFSPNAVSTDATAATTNFPVDLLIEANRAGFVNNSLAFSRLTGGGQALVTSSNAAEFAAGGGTKFESNTSITPNVLGTASIILWNFRRAPGFFDVVCYTGTGSATTFNHNLAAVPEMMIVKSRNNSTNWAVYSAYLGGANPANRYVWLNSPNTLGGNAAYWNNTAPNSTVFTVGTTAATNASSYSYVAYLFASVAGVSKVGSYTGTGTTQQINCGFTGGARFVLIKRTDSTGDWYVWDSARGIVAGNDSYLLLNSTAAEVTNTDYIDTYSAGFEISSTAPADINANGGTYIFLAVA